MKGISAARTQCTKARFDRANLVLGLAFVALLGAFLNGTFDRAIGTVTSAVVLASKRSVDVEDPLRRNVRSILTRLNVTTQVAVPDDYDGAVPQMWTCSDRPTFPFTKKLIFVHIFKTAGSTFRAFFQEYAQSCHKSFSLVVQCSTVSSNSMRNYTSSWRNAASHKQKPCLNRFSTKRDDVSVAVKSTAKLNINTEVTSERLRNHSDILIGHFPLGVHRYLFDLEDKIPDAQYVAFFRDPVAKYVSGRLFVNRQKKWTFDQAVETIKRGVTSERSQGSFYLGCDKYLITPEQQGLSLTLEERVDLATKNLIQFPCIVGIVERMGDSLSLLQRAIDGKFELTDEIQQLDMTRSKNENEASRNTSDSVVRNKSELSTSALVAELTNDEDFYFMLLDYLKYEYMIYDFALQLHARQVEALFDRDGDGNDKTDRRFL